MVHDVFISYSHEDKLVADAICAKLESNQIRCWIAPRDIAPGDKYASALIHAIDHSAVIVVVFSSKADKSPHVRTEIERAFNNEKIIIPFRIENIEPCDEMQYFIGRRHWLDALTPPLEEHINNLIKVLKKNFDTDFKKNETNSKNTFREEKFAVKTELEEVPQMGGHTALEKPQIPVATTSQKGESGTSKTKKYIVFGLVGIIVLIIIAAVFYSVKPGDGGFSISSVIKPGDTVVIDCTLFDAAGNPILTTDEALYTSTTTNTPGIVLSRQISLTANQTLSGSLYPVQIYTTDNGWSKQFAIFSPEYNAISSGVVGMKINEKKRISLLSGDSMTQDWSADQLMSNNLIMSDVTIGDILIMGISDSSGEVSNPSAAQYVRLGEVVDKSSTGIKVDFGYPIAEVKIVSINKR